MRNLFSRPLASGGLPFAPVHHHIDPLTIGLGVGVLGAGLNYLTTSQANSANKQIARETNAQNYKIWREQLAANREMWNGQVLENRKIADTAYNRQRQLISDERAYNDPNAIKNRLLQAGINPAYAMGTGAFGIMQSGTGVSAGSAPSSSVPSAPSMQTGSPQVPIDLGSGIGYGLQTYLAHKQETREDYRLAHDITYSLNRLKIDNLKALSEAKKVGIDDRRLRFEEDSFNKNLAFEKDKWRDSLSQISHQNAMDEIRTDIERFDADTRRLATMSGIAVNSAQISNLYQSVNESVERVRQMRLDGVSQRAIDALIRKEKSELIKQLLRGNKFGNATLKMDYYNKCLDFVNNVFQPVYGVASDAGIIPQGDPLKAIGRVLK